jgi:CYTH domain-containing protein
MEIERKFLVREMPADLERFACRRIEQAYLCTNPVLRIRRDNDDYYMTYKSGGMMAREEYEHPLNAQAYRHLLEKADGNIISKRRYMIPLGAYTAELDVFEGVHEGLVIVEVEFPDQAQAEAFMPPAWFGQEVTFDGRYHNSYLSRQESHTQ